MLSKVRHEQGTKLRRVTLGLARARPLYSVLSVQKDKGGKDCQEQSCLMESQSNERHKLS